MGRKKEAETQLHLVKLLASERACDQHGVEDAISTKQYPCLY